MKSSHSSNDNGSMVIALAISMIVMLIATAITATVISGIVATKQALNRAEARSELENILGLVQVKWLDIPIIIAGEPNPNNCLDPATLYSTSTYGGGVKLRGDWQVCFESERLAGELPLEGVKLTARVSTQEKTRYYQAHIHGTPGRFSYTVNSGLGMKPADDLYASSFGFSSGSKLTAGTNGGTLNTYTLGSVVTPGAPLSAPSIELGVKNSGITRRTTSSSSRIAAGSCFGAGCASTTFTDLRFSLDAGAYDYKPSSCPAAVSGFESAWRSSAAPTPGVLTTPAEGACYNSVIFDRNTTVSGNARLYVSGTVTVEPGVTVNVTSAYPDAKKLRISGPTSGDGQPQLIMQAGSSMAARTSFVYAGCDITGATYYGSLSCGEYLDADAAKLWFQQDLTEIVNLDGRPGWPPGNLQVVPDDWNNIQFKEVNKTEAGY